MDKQKIKSILKFLLILSAICVVEIIVTILSMRGTSFDVGLPCPVCGLVYLLIFLGVSLVINFFVGILLAPESWSIWMKILAGVFSIVFTFAFLILIIGGILLIGKTQTFITDKLIERAVRAEDPAKCAELRIVELRKTAGCKESLCYYKLAGLTNDLSLCEKINSKLYCAGRRHYDCIRNYAITNKNISVCELLPGQKNFTCIKDYAIANKNKSICELLPDYYKDPDWYPGFTYRECIKRAS